MLLVFFKVVLMVARLLDSSFLEWSSAYNNLPNSLKISFLSLTPLVGFLNCLITLLYLYRYLHFQVDIIHIRGNPGAVF